MKVIAVAAAAVAVEAKSLRAETGSPMLKCNNQHQCSAAKDGNGYECKSTYEMTGPHPYIEAFGDCQLMEENNGFRDRVNSSMMEKKLKCNPAAEEKMGKRFFCIEQQEAVYHAGIVVPEGPNHKRGSFALTNDGWWVYDFAHWCCEV